MTRLCAPTDPHLLLHMVWHCYLEAEHEMYGSLPAVSARRAVDITFERFAEAPFMEDFNAWSLEELLKKLKRWSFVEEVVVREEEKGGIPLRD